MKKLMKNIIKNVKILINSLLALIIGIIKYLIDKIKFRKPRLFNNGGKDQVLLMGNGPSLNCIDLKKVRYKKIKICCVNYFPLKKQREFFEIKPEFLCLMDPGFFDYTIKAEEDDKKLLFDILEKVDWDLIIIAPVGKRLPVVNEAICYEWVNTYKSSYDCVASLNYRLYKNNLAIVGMQNVIIAGLFYFLTVGFQKVYLTGVDMSDFKNLYVDKSNRVYVDSTHSYGTTRYYYDEMTECGISGFGNILGTYQNMFIEFDQLSRYAKYLNIEVLNLSINSYIDSFEKKDPMDLGFGRI